MQYFELTVPDIKISIRILIQSALDITVIKKNNQMFFFLVYLVICILRNS
jgi:uncharacterized protein YaaN involved in tellurite resistance